MSNKKSTGKFILGAALGAGLALLFAPDKGEVTRRKLRLKLDELYSKAKNIDVDEVRNEIVRKVNDIKEELSDLDKEKVLKVAEKQAKNIQKKADKLYKYVAERGTPILEEASKEVKEKALDVAKNVVTKLENEENPKKRSVAKKKK